MVWRLIVPWFPWLVAEAALGYVEALLWPQGGLWLLAIWTIVLILYRTIVVASERRLVRLGGDAVFAGLCCVAVFEGGWFVLPAVAAFALCDAAGLSIELPTLPGDPAGHELSAALAATLAGWLGLAIAVSGPIYATASSIVEANGQVLNIPPQVGLLQVGAAPSTVALLASMAFLFGLVPVGATVHGLARRPESWLVHAAIAFALTALAILALPVVGLWPAPGVLVAWLVVHLARPASTPVAG